MRSKIIAANWKMNGSLAANDALLRAVAIGAGKTAAQVVICAPFPYLAQAQALVQGTQLKLGAQTLSEHAAGAYTGEVSASMLKEFGCSHVIVGHSERRALFGESDTQVAAKVVAALGAGMTPILCVGETLAQREAGETRAVIEAQLDAVLAGLDAAALKNLVIAYEPVWAIGTGRTASPEQAQEVHAWIRERIARFDASAAMNISVLYGGSMKAANAAQLLQQPDIDGGLIGGASLIAADFLAIVDSVV
jgi:triosephosphate isomerase